MAFAVTSLDSGSIELDQSSYVTGVFTPEPNSLTVAFFANPNKNDSLGPQLIGGMANDHGFRGPWERLNKNDFDITGIQRGSMSCWAAVSEEAVLTSDLTVVIGGGQAGGLRWAIFSITGIPLDTIGPGSEVGTSIIQCVAASGVGTSGSVTLASASHADNRVLSAFAPETAAQAITPRAGWTELYEVFGANPGQTLEVQYNFDSFDTTATASWTSSVAWGGIALELNGDLTPAELAGKRIRTATQVSTTGSSSGTFSA